jgi:hypothetical protein
MNEHSQFIDKRIADIKKQSKWQSYIIDTSHDDFIHDYSLCVFTNLVNQTFTKSYLSKNFCSDCGERPQHRCHGINEDRPMLIRRALQRVWPDTTQKIKMIDIVVAFLEEHKTTSFALKCETCHKKEPKIKGKRKAYRNK